MSDTLKRECGLAIYVRAGVSEMSPTLPNNAKQINP
jgi:hypothetical protein